MTPDRHDAALAAMLAELTRAAGLPAPTQPLTPSEIERRIAEPQDPRR